MPDSSQELHVVTGAFGYSGRYLAARLLAAGHRVRTLTASGGRANSFGGAVEVHPFQFEEPERLVASLRGAATLYNTYWIRFNQGSFGHAQAVRNTLTLFHAARRAGVRRLVHVSITNPSLSSALAYFRGKAELEKALAESGLSHAILRPAVLFGAEDILINNIAWTLRRFPVFGVFGNGEYRLQPIYVDDLARLAVEQGQAQANVIINAIGPETYTYRGLVRRIGELIGCRRPVVAVPPSLGYAVGWLLGKMLGDVMITRAEIAGLMQGLLAVDVPPVGETNLSDWVRAHAATLGRHYASELARRRNRVAAYEQL